MGELAEILDAFLRVASGKSAYHEALARCIARCNDAEKITVFYVVLFFVVVLWRSRKDRYKRALATVVGLVWPFNRKAARG